MRDSEAAQGIDRAVQLTMGKQLTYDDILAAEARLNPSPADWDDEVKALLEVSDVRAEKKTGRGYRNATLPGGGV